MIVRDDAGHKGVFKGRMYALEIAAPARTGLGAVALLALLSACGDESSGSPGAAGGCKSFDTTYDAIQTLIFDGKGCTQAACHGQAASGGLDLRAGKALDNLVDAPSEGSSLARIQPGTATASYLYQKLLAATEPGSVQIAGSPMPAGGAAPLTRDELEAVRIWIARGAPRDRNVGDDNGDPTTVARLLNACLPATADPVIVKPLDPPARDAGIQFVMPIYTLASGSEIENCTPFVYDFADQVPAEFKDPERNVMFVNGAHTRQDPQSHHLVLSNPGLPLDSPAEAALGPWTCRDGERDGQTCKPALGGSDCAAGVCAGQTKQSVACIGIGAGNGIANQIANAQAPQQYIPPREGVFWEVPLSGILFFNSHAFNLTKQDVLLNGRINFYFAGDRRRKLEAVNDVSNLYIAAGQPPFTKQTYCASHVVARGSAIVVLTGHTHKRGEHFWVTDPGGAMIYENFTYNDPLYKEFDPWLTFDAENAADRTLTYCATFNNGVDAGGFPDPSLVTRASRMPDRASCTPVACVSGRLAAECAVDTDCDTASGAGDGSCDACPITRGVTTEDEMFVLMPWFARPEVVPQ